MQNFTKSINFQVPSLRYFTDQASHHKHYSGVDLFGLLQRSCFVHEKKTDLCCC